MQIDSTNIQEDPSSLEGYTSKLDSLIEEFSKLYTRAAETNSACKIRTKLIKGLADGLSH